MCRVPVCPILGLFSQIIAAKSRKRNTYLSFSRVSKAHWDGDIIASNHELSQVVSLSQEDQARWQAEKIAYLTIKPPFLIRTYIPMMALFTNEPSDIYQQKEQKLRSYGYIGSLGAACNPIGPPNTGPPPHRAYTYNVSFGDVSGLVAAGECAAASISRSIVAYPTRGHDISWSGHANVWRLKREQCES